MMRRIVFHIIFFLIFCAGSFAVLSHKPTPSPCKVKHLTDEKIEWECKRLKKKETFEGLFGDRWQDVVRFNRMDRRHIYVGLPFKVPKNLEQIKDFNPMPQDYPDAENEEKFIFINLSEQFLGAYEYGKLVFSFPIAAGEEGHETPSGKFKITAVHSKHKSSLYKIEGRDIPYPMTYALRFYTTPKGVTYWIHGRDIPGYPASHGCIGLFDEVMQKRYYGFPKNPVLEDAKRLFEWVISPMKDDGKFHLIDGPKVLIIGNAPRPSV